MTIHGFDLISDRRIPELNSTAKLYRHSATGAELLSLENDDENKVFGVTFATPPTDSTGVPHILEHSVLCGSEKYPLRKPFVELKKSSLKTFLNAWTLPDRTSYPVASTNLRDFYNLVEVYMDAVFHPRLTPEILQQEGWHYELENGALIYKGVVFNEMKGAYSSPDRMIAKHSLTSLFPDTTYAVDSGGDPEQIPALTFEQFKSFHETFYHPSNAFFYFYGDDPAEERLRIVAEQIARVTRDSQGAQAGKKIPIQPPFDSPRRLQFGYDAGSDNSTAKGMVTVNWVLRPNGDIEHILAFTVLNYILIGTAASPLRKALIDSKLGEDLTGLGFEDELLQTIFSIGLKGIVPEAADKVEALILNTLQTLAEQGIDTDLIEAALNTIEFRLRENNTGSFPRGLMLMRRALSSWLFGGDPVSYLAFEEPLDRIKVQATSVYFQKLITDYLLNNPHRTTVILHPDSNWRKGQDETEKLVQVYAGMDQAALAGVGETAQRLQHLQETPETPEALASIPTLERTDLDSHVKTAPLTVIESAGGQILYHDLFTNGIVYLDAGFNLHALPQEYLPYASIFSRALLQMGTQSEDYVHLLQRIGRLTGGISTTIFSTTARGTETAATWFFARGKATLSQVTDLLDILSDVLLTVKLDDPERFRQIVLKEKASHEAYLIPGGYNVVDTRTRTPFNEADWASEQMEGINYLIFLRQLADAVVNDWSGVLTHLETVRQILINRAMMVVNVTVDHQTFQQIQPQITAFIEGLPSAVPHIAPWLPVHLPAHEGLTIPAQVNYVAKGADLYKLGYAFSGSALVVLNYLRNTWLWDQIRVRGGAYGAYCMFEERSGVLNYVSYRDPNLLKTLDVYDETPRFLRQTALSDAELTRNIIGAIGVLDTYQLPDTKGYVSMVRHLTNTTDDFRQKTRDEVLATTPADFVAFAEALDQVRDNGRVVVLGSFEAIQAANEAKGGQWLEISKIL